MARNQSCTVYVGNLDEKVTERVLYEILIQAGRVVDLYVPRDRETNRPKGYAFAEYETEETANYAVDLFSGLVSLNRRLLKFAISGQDKPSQEFSTPTAPSNVEVIRNSPSLLTPCSLSSYNTQSNSSNYSQGSRRYGPGVPGNSFEHSRRSFAASLESIHQNHSARSSQKPRHPDSYSPY